MAKKNLPVSEQVPPQNTEAEKAFIASMLLEEDALIRGLEIIKKDFFYDNRHQLIFSAMQDLFEKNIKCNLITLSNYLKEINKIDQAGGIEYLTSLFDFVPTAAHIEDYAKIVKDTFVLRTLINTSTKIITEAYSGVQDVDGLLDRAETMIFDVSEHMISREAYPISTLVKENLDLFEKIHARQDRVTGLPTGYIDLDNITSGFQRSDFIVIAARPSMGKTAFACNIAQNLAVTQNVPVLIFSLEMSKEQLVQRMLCSEARIDSSLMRKGILSDRDMGKLIQAAGILEKTPIFIDDTPALSIFELRARARRLKSRENIQMVIVDYLQLMRGRARYENRQQEITDISASLKAMAKELSIPVIALSQMNRLIERREDKKPILADLRESGSIEQDADLVLFLHRDEQYDDSEEAKGITDILIAKHRNGPLGQVRLTFLKQYLRFENYTQKHP
ncbi:MAG TPA: replicative DNA helicase [Candidatus Ratteibacteria bacterium]|uniref:Replicative DNA helicase n=1 Tax=candidate division TA06 bacterium ADurb.Bin131 TaxID=1852827 RepID=A0A1V6CA30_UNCT6|nr:MAG: Replicative DNA helicase [candidate division TA06 bacterium ADurb.Bin131]HON05825.1 replicative DNA helicase [bacterium]HRS06394.1 replicative DNA helicase [Candidatus Ratteibacteria bacterium]HOQ81512.1 replicative DNA helicase [bacterium]HPC28846.1 replicative DNA helicase [bacterium]